MKQAIKIFSCLLVVAILSTSVPCGESNYSVNASKSVDEMEKEIANLEKEQAALSDKINNAQAAQKSEKEKQILISSQISTTEEQIKLYQDKIDVVVDEIADKEIEIQEQLISIEENEEAFALRVKAMYISNVSNSTLSTVLSSESFSQFLNTTEIMKRISESDKDLIQDLSTQKVKLEQTRQELEDEQASLEQSEKDLETKQSSLVSLYQQSSSAEAASKLAEKAYMDEKAAKAAEIKAIEKAVDDAIAAAGNTGTAPQGQLQWPVPSSSRITSYFGPRTLWGAYDNHLGIDIADSAGKAIVAAEAGEVILVKKSSTGYGWHVIINHGGGYVTLYAHCSRIDVTEGQKVTRGQTIAGIGTTGASTGNHLHFEVRINGQYQNPLNYVKSP